MEKLKKSLWIAAGFICTLLAIVAYIVPLLPTPPFLAGALFCFAKGSKKFHDWLLYRTIFGKYFTIFMEKKALPRKFKYATIAILILGAIFSCVFVLPDWTLRAVLIFFITITVIAVWSVRNIEDFESS